MKTKIENVTVITSNHRYPLVSLWEMSPTDQATVKKEFGWIDDSSAETWDDAQFFKYRDNWYCLHDFMRFTHTPAWAKGYHAYSNDSFFSGVMLKYNDDTDTIIVATFYS